jgi:hypothetical protein
MPIRAVIVAGIESHSRAVLVMVAWKRRSLPTACLPGAATA